MSRTLDAKHCKLIGILISIDRRDYSRERDTATRGNEAQQDTGRIGSG